MKLSHSCLEAELPFSCLAYVHPKSHPMVSSPLELEHVIHLTLVQVLTCDHRSMLRVSTIKSTQLSAQPFLLCRTNTSSSATQGCINVITAQAFKHAHHRQIHPRQPR